jgi:hypothetical protein
MGTVQVLLVDNTDEAHGCYLIAEPRIEVTTADLPDMVEHDGVAYHRAGYRGSAPMYLTVYRPGPMPTDLVERPAPAYVDELDSVDVTPGWL